MDGILVEIFSEIICLYTAVKGACVASVECRTKNEKPPDTNKNDNNNNNIYDNAGNKYEDRNNSKGVTHDKSVYESDSFLNAYYCHFINLTSPPDKQLIQSFQNMKKSLLLIINYSTECNTLGLSALLPLPKHYHDLLPKKVQFALGERKEK
jgi:hypothetical protein